VGAPTTILVARHADAEYETHHWADEGGSLTHAGRVEAHALGRRLAVRGVTHVWTSTFARAVQTAEIAAAELGVTVTTREALREFSVGWLAGSRAEDPFAETYRAWLSGDLDRRLPGGETGAELRHRMHHVLHEIAERHRGETVLAVSHGGLMRLTLPLILIQEPEDPAARLGNCAIVEMTVDGPLAMRALAGCGTRGVAPPRDLE
jgi:2,3-bisphosphoglycerate-dependent phosphoglycerate mutase